MAWCSISTPRWAKVGLRRRTLPTIGTICPSWRTEMHELRSVGSTNKAYRHMTCNIASNDKRGWRQLPPDSSCLRACIQSTLIAFSSFSYIAERTTPSRSTGSLQEKQRHRYRTRITLAVFAIKHVLHHFAAFGVHLTGSIVATKIAAGSRPRFFRAAFGAAIGKAGFVRA